jgi:acyl-CoA synthetase (AMP-forming)/AMP-acid ligase II/acyl carrier protein
LAGTVNIFTSAGKPRGHARSQALEEAQMDLSSTGSLTLMTPRRSGSAMKLAFSDGGPLHIDPGAPKTLTEAILQTAARHPAKGIVFYNSDGSESFQSYPALLAEALRILGGLQARGLQPRDRVILQVELLKDHFSTFWACILGGITPVNVAVAPSYHEVGGVINKLHNTWELLGHPAIIASGHLVKPIAGLGALLPAMAQAKTISVDDLKQSDASGRIHQSAPSDLVFFQLTSGSTGVPKCIQETHRCIIAHIHLSQQFNGFLPGDITFNWLPVDHVVPTLTYHLKDTYLGCQQIHAKSDVVLSNPLKWLDIMDRHRVTHTWSPNFGYKLLSDRLAQNNHRSWDLSCLKFMINAGEQVTVPVVREFLRLAAPFGVKPGMIQPAFGMAESCTAITYTNDFNFETSVHRLLKSSLGSVLKPSKDENPATTIMFADLGPPAPGIQIRITDEHNKTVPEAMIGRLQIKGPVVTPGYLNNDAANREAFVGDDWFNTGDLGFILNGRLTLTGREKELIIVRGANFYCYEIEDVVNRIDGVEPTFCAACAVDDIGTGTEGLAIFFVAKEGRSDAQNLQLLKTIRMRVASELGIAPTFVIPLARAEFPKTTSGKIQRSQLKKALAAGAFNTLLETLSEQLRQADRMARVLPRNEIEVRIALIWRDLLKIPEVGVTESFFELGGDSLLAAQVISRIREAFRSSVPLSKLFEASTVEKLGQALLEHECKPGQMLRTAELLKQIETMSAEEVHHLLHAKRQAKGTAK